MHRFRPSINSFFSCIFFSTSYPRSFCIPNQTLNEDEGYQKVFSFSKMYSCLSPTHPTKSYFMSSSCLLLPFKRFFSNSDPLCVIRHGCSNLNPTEVVQKDVDVGPVHSNITRQNSVGRSLFQSSGRDLCNINRIGSKSKKTK